MFGRCDINTDSKQELYFSQKQLPENIAHAMYNS